MDTQEAPPLTTEALYQPQPGDLVRCVVEGYVTEAFSHGTHLAASTAAEHPVGGSFIAARISPTWTLLESAPPAPVVTFGPGDIIRDKRTGVLVHLADTGYLHGTTWHSWPVTDNLRLTSEWFERVPMGGTA